MAALALRAVALTTACQVAQAIAIFIYEVRASGAVTTLACTHQVTLAIAIFIHKVGASGAESAGPVALARTHQVTLAIAVFVNEVSPWLRSHASSNRLLGRCQRDTYHHDSY